MALDVKKRMTKLGDFRCRVETNSRVNYFDSGLLLVIGLGRGLRLNEPTFDSFGLKLLLPALKLLDVVELELNPGGIAANHFGFFYIKSL